MTQVSCPGCGRKQPHSGRRGTLYYCEVCRCQFDDDPDEGSPTTYNDPVKSLEAKERRGQRRRR